MCGIDHLIVAARVAQYFNRSARRISLGCCQPTYHASTMGFFKSKIGLRLVSMACARSRDNQVQMENDNQPASSGGAG
jgi:hypothetical protein